MSTSYKTIGIARNHVRETIGQPIKSAHGTAFTVYGCVIRGRSKNNGRMNEYEVGVWEVYEAHLERADAEDLERLERMLAAAKKRAAGDGVGV